MLEYQNKINLICWFSPISMSWGKKKAEWFLKSLFQDYKEESSDQAFELFSMNGIRRVDCRWIRVLYLNDVNFNGKLSSWKKLESRGWLIFGEVGED